MRRIRRCSDDSY